MNIKDKDLLFGYVYIVIIAGHHQTKSLTAYFCNPMISWLQLFVRAYLITDSYSVPSPKFVMFDVRYVFTDSGSKRYTCQLKCNCFNIFLYLPSYGTIEEYVIDRPDSSDHPCLSLLPVSVRLNICWSIIPQLISPLIELSTNTSNILRHIHIHEHFSFLTNTYFAQLCAPLLAHGYRFFLRSYYSFSHSHMQISLKSSLQKSLIP